MLNIFANGLWPIHLIFYAGVIACVVGAVLRRKNSKGSVSGGSTSDPELHYDSESFPLLKMWEFKFAAIIVVVYVGLIVLGAFE